MMINRSYRWILSRISVFQLMHFKCLVRIRCSYSVYVNKHFSGKRRCHRWKAMERKKKCTQLKVKLQEYCIRYWSILLKNANWCLVAGGDELIILTNYLYYCANTMQQLVHHVPIYVIAKLSLFFPFSVFSLQKYFIYEIFDAERFIAVAFFRFLSPFLTIFVHKSPIIFEENIFKMHFFHSLRLLFVLRAFYALQSILELQYKVVLSVRVPRTNTSYFVWIFRE